MILAVDVKIFYFLPVFLVGVSSPFFGCDWSIFTNYHLVVKLMDWSSNNLYFFIFVAGLEYVGHASAYVTHFVFLRDVWIRTQKAAVISRRATNSPFPFFIFFCIFFSGLECVGHFFAYVAHFVFLGNVWIRTQRDAVACRCTASFATRLPFLFLYFFVYFLAD